MHLSSEAMKALTPLARQDVFVACLQYRSWKIKQDRLVTRWAESAWRYLDGQPVFHRNQRRDNRYHHQHSVTDFLRGLLKMFAEDDNYEYVTAKDSYNFWGFRPTLNSELQRLGCGRVCGTPYSPYQVKQGLLVLERCGLVERQYAVTGKGKGRKLLLRLRTDRLWMALDILSTAKRKEALPDPAKINPELKKCASENLNKHATDEARPTAVDRRSLILKGQPNSDAVVPTSTFHCSVEQVIGGESVVETTQAKGSDGASDTSSVWMDRHNADDVMESIPADYGSRELVQLLELVRNSFATEKAGFTWRHARQVTRHFNEVNEQRKMTFENLTDYLAHTGGAPEWFYHLGLDEVLRIWPVVLKHHTRNVMVGSHGMNSASEAALGSIQAAVNNETRAESNRYRQRMRTQEVVSGRPASIGGVSTQGRPALYAFLASVQLNRPELAGEIAVGRKACILKALHDDPAWALAVRKLMPTLDTMLGLGNDVWDGFARQAHVEFKQNLVRAFVANDLGVPQDKYVRLTKHVGEFIE